jgi:hypothetical protein
MDAAMIAAFRAATLASIVLAMACGSDRPSTPTSPAPIPAAEACGALGSFGSGLDGRISILSGAVCSPDRSPVVKLNMRTASNIPVGACSGTIVMPRVVLTAAHCVDEDVSIVRVWPGTGPEFVAESFVHYPDYRFDRPNVFDVALVFMNEDMPRTPVPVLTSREGRTGETAIIAGWGRDESDVTFLLRAGSTTLSAVTGAVLQTRYAPPASSVCSGDSGGPLLLFEAGAWAVAGITSATSTSDCNRGLNIYQAIRNENVRQFILQHASGIPQR